MALTLPDPFPAGSLPALDEVDDLLVEYLEAVELYQLAQQRLADELKRGWFELSRAKVALGPLRLSQRGYNLAQTDSRVAVSIDESGWSLTESSTCIAAKEQLERAKQAAAEAAATATTAPDHAPTSTATSTVDSTGLRNRSAPAQSGTTSATATDPRAAPRPTSRDPIHQFSAMPPSSLIASQSNFEQAANAAVLVASRRAQVDRVEVRLSEAKARLAASLGGEPAEVAQRGAAKPKKKKK